MQMIYQIIYLTIPNPQLDQMGISGVDWNSIQSIQPNSVFSQILKMLGEGVQAPMKALLSLLWNYDALRFYGQYENQFGRKKIWAEL